MVFGMPLYADGIPSLTLKLMEKMEKQYKGSQKQIYVVANMGFYGNRQIVKLLGKMIRIPDATNTAAWNVALALEKLGNAISASESIADQYADAYKFPRWKYQYAGNIGWVKSAKKNGLTKKDIRRKVDLGTGFVGHFKIEVWLAEAKQIDRVIFYLVRGRTFELVETKL